MKKIAYFFSNIKEYTTPDAVIQHLDLNFPQWRAELKHEEAWKDAFEYDIKIYQNTYLSDFADMLFDEIDNIEAEKMVWNNKNCNEFYRWAAIKRLRIYDKDTYLPLYIDALKKGEFLLGGWGFTIVDELFDFPSAISVTTEICRNNDMNTSIGQVALEYLANKACEHWDDYTDFIRHSIITKRDYFILKKATPGFWSKLSEPHKNLLVNRVSINEIKQYHDIIAFYQYVDNRENSRLMFFNAMWDFKTKSPDESKSQLLRELNTLFDMPTVDFETNQYTPSELITRFLNLTDNDADTMLHSILKSVVNKMPWEGRYQMILDKL
jgi:hypothetical protein